jgi:GGDEF domain-containing protein
MPFESSKQVPDGGASRRQDRGRPGATMRVAGHDFSITASVGIAIASPTHPTAEQLLAMAEDAMYRAKERRRGN